MAFALKLRLVARCLATGLVAGVSPTALAAYAPETATAAQECAVIGGFVYYDINGNGVREQGEPGLGGVPMQLKDASGATVGLSTTGSDGYYEFGRSLAGASVLLTETHTAAFPALPAPWSDERSLPAFDAARGVLDSVQVLVDASVEATVRVEHTGAAPRAIVAQSGGRVLVAAGRVQAAAEAASGAAEFSATAYDGVTDFAGTSGHNFGAVELTAGASGTAAVGALAAFSGSGSVVVAAEAQPLTGASGASDLVVETETAVSAEVTLVYRYREVDCLEAGPYTVFQVEQPPGYGDGQESRDFEAVGSSGESDELPVTLSGSSTSNNFGERSGSLQGCVFVDSNESRARDPQEAGIAGVAIALDGPKAATQLTWEDGCYLFVNLPPGEYTIRQGQPGGFETCGGEAAGGDVLEGIRLPANVHLPGNDFAECPLPEAVAQGSVSPGPDEAASPDSSPRAAAPASRPGDSASPEGAPGTERGIVNSAVPPGPAAPGAGTGKSDQSPDVRLVILGFAIFAASGWIAFIALGRAMDRREE